MRRAGRAADRACRSCGCARRFSGTDYFWISIGSHFGGGDHVAIWRPLPGDCRICRSPGHRRKRGVVTTSRVHFIGVCGTAMATLAAMLKQKGVDVRGSDQDVYPPMSDFLAAEGVTVFSGYRAEQITGDLDLVIVGNAISRGNVELEEVLDRKIRYCSLPEAIRDHFLWAARSIVIAGTHGKTTTTALTGWVLTHGGVDPSILIGGIARNFGHQGSSYRMGHG